VIRLLACASFDPTSREPQRVDAPPGELVALLADRDGHVLVTSGGAARLGGGRIDVPAGPPITGAELGPDGALVLVRAGDPPPVPIPDGAFLKGRSGPLAVGGGPGPHGEADGWLVSLPDRREVWLGGPGWEVLNAVAPLGDGWLAAGVGQDVRGAVTVSGAVWLVRLDAALAPAWQQRLGGGLDHVAAVVAVGDAAVVLALGGAWDDPLKPLSGSVVRPGGDVRALPDLGLVRDVVAAPAGAGGILLATTDRAGHVFVRRLEVP
jgi:hypothetical protein